MADIPGLPPGFKVDTQPATPPLPEGFALDSPAAPAAPQRGVMDYIKGGADAAASAVANNVTTPVLGGIAGLIARTISAVHGDNTDAAAQAAHEFVDRTVGYHTRTPVGQEIAQSAQNAVAPIGKAANFLKEGAENTGLSMGLDKPNIDQALGTAGDIAGALPAVGAIGKLASAASAAKAATVAGDTAGQVGFRTAENNPIAQSVAGTSGKQALILHNQKIGNTIAATEAGHAPTSPMSNESLAQAREPANGVYNRVANALPTGKLDAQAAQEVHAAAGGGSPLVAKDKNAAALIAEQKDLLTSNDIDGQTAMSTLRELRRQGYANTASEDASAQTIGRSQLGMARALEGHIERNLPANADVSLDQFKQAREALAKNHAVEGALRGGDIDLQALARIQRSDPGLLTGGLKEAADFANANKPVTTLGNNIYQKPGYINDLASGVRSGAGLGDLVRAATVGVTGATAGARRVLTGSTADAIQKALGAFPGRPADTFAPIPPKPAPAIAGLLPAPSMVNGGGGATTASTLSDELGLTQDVQRAGQQHPAAVPTGTGPGLSLGDMVAPPQGAPFRHDASAMAGNLSLAPEAGPGGALQPMGDFAKVLSQGVPEGIMQKTAPPVQRNLADMVAPVGGGLTTYHGSANDFPVFDNQKINTGEGNQSYGVGHYVTETPAVSDEYIPDKGGYRMTVKVKGEAAQNFMDWDKPLSDQPNVLKALGLKPDAVKKLNGIDPEWSGQELHDALLKGKTNLDVGMTKQAVSDWLASKGVRGVSYLDGKSRKGGAGSRNFVVFDPKDMEITKSEKVDKGE